MGGKLSVWDFHKWLQEISWEMPADSSQELVKSVGNILSIFDQYYEGDMDENQLIDMLGGFPIFVISNVSPSKLEMKGDVLRYRRIFEPSYPVAAFI